MLTAKLGVWLRRASQQVKFEGSGVNSLNKLQVFVDVPVDGQLAGKELQVWNDQGVAMGEEYRRFLDPT